MVFVSIQVLTCLDLQNNWDILVLISAVWRNSETFLRRLVCTKQNSFAHLIPQRDEDELYHDTPIFTCKFAPKFNNDHVVALANEDGKLAIHDSKSNSRLVYIFIM